MKRLLLLPLVFLIFVENPTLAQEYHFIHFSDKNPGLHGEPSNFLSEKALERRERQGIPINLRDYPVTPEYLDSIAARGGTVKYSSRWFNAALVQAEAQAVQAIMELPFVRKSDPLNRRKGGTRVNGVHKSTSYEQILQEETYEYGAAFSQNSFHGIPQMHADGLEGQGIDIAVIDAGFRMADKLPVFQPMIGSERLKGTYDFVSQNEDVFGNNEGEASIDGDHGTKVLSVMAAMEEGKMVGVAPKANYWLLKSEDSGSELPVEEVYWAMAAEYADSVGADIINTSLGYFDFDKSEYNHSKDEFDGDQLIITRAADYAAAAGILVVTSAGNQGNRAWGYLTAPSDADSILTVGGVYPDGEYWPSSSHGPTADGRLKPNVCAQSVSVALASTSGAISSGSGTSYAAPIMAGLAAGLWQAYPELNNMDMIELLQRAGSQAESPTNTVGYGAPSYTRAEAIMRLTSRSQETDKPLDAISLKPNPSSGEVELVMPQGLSGQECRVAVMDMTGRVLYAKELKANQNFKLPDYANSGIYLVKVQAKGSQKNIKLVLNR